MRKEVFKMSPKRATQNDKPEVRELARLLRKAAPLATLVNSDEFSDEDRSRLRELVGLKPYFDLTTNLNQMCSVLARLMGRAGHDPKARAALRARGLAQDAGRWTR